MVFADPALGGALFHALAALRVEASPLPCMADAARTHADAVAKILVKAGGASDGAAGFGPLLGPLLGLVGPGGAPAGTGAATAPALQLPPPPPGAAGAAKATATVAKALTTDEAAVFGVFAAVGPRAPVRLS